MTEDEPNSSKGMVPANLVETLTKALEAQAQDIAFKSEQLEVEKQRIEIDKQKDDHAFAFGMASLETQAADRRHAREISRKEKTDGHWLIFGVLVAVAGLISYALYLDKDEIAQELVKAIIFLTAGAVAGYGLAARKKGKDNNSPPDQDV